jgi:hypothetical protein
MKGRKGAREREVGEKMNKREAERRWLERRRDSSQNALRVRRRVFLWRLCPVPCRNILWLHWCEFVRVYQKDVISCQ